MFIRDLAAGAVVAINLRDPRRAMPRFTEPMPGGCKAASPLVCLPLRPPTALLLACWWLSLFTCPASLSGQPNHALSVRLSVM